MPTPSTSKWPKPRSEDEFEDIVVDFVRIRWEDPHAARNGRRGQRQNGVDIVGHPSQLEGNRAAAQCKNTERLTLAVVLAEIEKARGFEGGLEELLVVTSAERDAQLQAKVHARLRTSPAPFRVEIVFWDDIVADLSQEPAIVEKHWKGFASSKESDVDAFRDRARDSQHALARRTVARCRALELAWHRGLDLWKMLTQVPGNDLAAHLGAIPNQMMQFRAELGELVAELDALFGKGTSGPIHHLVLFLDDLATGISAEISRSIGQQIRPEILPIFHVRAGYDDIVPAKARVTALVDLIEEWAGPYLGRGTEVMSQAQVRERLETMYNANALRICETLSTRAPTATPLSQQDAKRAALAVLGGDVVRATSHVDGGAVHVVAARRSNVKSLDVRVYLLEEVGATFREIWRSEELLSHFSDNRVLESDDIDGDGTSEILFTDAQRGTHQNSEYLHVYFPRTKQLYSISEHSNPSALARPRTPSVDLEPEPPAELRDALIQAALSRGFLRQAPDDDGQPQDAVRRWLRDNGPDADGPVDVVWYAGEPEWPTAPREDLVVGDVVWRAYFKGPMFHFDSAAVRYYVAYAPDDRYSWAKALTWDGESLWFGIHVEKGLVRFHEPTKTLQRIRTFNNQPLPLIEELEYEPTAGILIVNKTLSVSLSELPPLPRR